MKLSEACGSLKHSVRPGNIISLVASSPEFSPLEVQIARIRELSKLGRHSEAIAAAEALVAKSPHDRDALYLIAANRRCLNHIADALMVLEQLERLHPRFSLLYQERGCCYMALRDLPRAIGAFSRAVTLNPALTSSWVMLERLYRGAEELERAAAVAQQVARLHGLPREVVRAGSLFSDGELDIAHDILDKYRATGGNHLEALRLLARIEHQRNNLEEAERLLEDALNLPPNYRAAKIDYVRILLDSQKYPKAIEVIESLLTLEPSNSEILHLYAAACVGLGRNERAIELYSQLLTASPSFAELHVALGHSFKSVGQQKQAIESYRTATTIRPNFGDAYWSLANLKTYPFMDDEVARMSAEERAPAIDLVDRYHLCFALGKAYEDRNEFAESWHFYERGNALKHSANGYSPEITEINTRKQIEVCTAEFFEARASVGASDPDPILIVGLPRSGSTLLEQILASHSLIDATQELPEIPRIAREMEGSRSDPYNPRYPSVLAELRADEFQKLGRRYLHDTRAYRGNKPFFIDKMPNNFRHIGLVHLMLPNAKIIDVRREPMACCFSNLKQLFASGQEFTYRIEDIARYYRSYLELMRHWHSVLPGRVLQVCYEDLVEDLEGNVRRILGFCGMKFDPACMQFYKRTGNIASASSEQVRQPIFRQGLFAWRKYEPWLNTLKEHLGEVLTRYRE